MSQCDVCQKPASQVKNPRYKTAEFQEIVRRGFLPDEVTLQKWAGRADLEKTASEWKARALSSSDDWLLCPECATRANQFRPPLGKTRPIWLYLTIGIVLVVIIAIAGWITSLPKSKALSIRGTLSAEATISSMAISQDGNQLATGSSEGGLSLFNVPDRKQTLYIEKAHDLNITAVCYSPDGTLLASTSVDNLIKLWQSNSTSPIHTLSGHTLAVKTLAFSPDGSLLASAGVDQTILIWKMPSGEPAFSLSGHTADVNGLTFSPDGSLLVSVSSDGTVKGWDLTAKTEKFSLPGHQIWVFAAAFSADGKILATADGKGMVKLWDPQNGDIIRTLNAHTSRINALQFSPNGNFLVTGGEDGMTKIWQVATWELKTTLETYGEEAFPIHSLAFSKDGSTLFAGNSYDIKIWNLDRLP